jgi:ferrochelatase
MDAQRRPRRAVVLFNLGGPDSLDAVRPFLFNLFNDRAIIGAPGPIRRLIATLISRRRAPVAREIYEKIGGRSPILEETQAQADALETALSEDAETRVFIAMRAWHPLTEEAAAAVKDFGPDEVALLPLYPQFSTATTGSALDEWRKQAERIGLNAPTRAICCYPAEPFFAEAYARGVRKMLDEMGRERPVRVLFSAHGLPERIIKSGDPYAWQTQRTVEAIVARIGRPDLDHVLCYQSRVGPLTWIRPATDDEIRRAGAERKAVIVVPIAFVSEHSETLVELDMEYSILARESGVPDYRRVPTLSADPMFIAGLAGLVRTALVRHPDLGPNGHSPANGLRLCPARFARCPCRSEPPA